MDSSDWLGPTTLPAIKNSAPADSPESLAGRNHCLIFFFEACKHIADYDDAGP